MFRLIKALSLKDKVVNPLSDGASDIGDALESGAVDISSTKSQNADIALRVNNCYSTVNICSLNCNRTKSNLILVAEISSVYIRTIAVYRSANCITASQLGGGHNRVETIE
jgi:hypothetical protein